MSLWKYAKSFPKGAFSRTNGSLRLDPIDPYFFDNDKKNIKRGFRVLFLVFRIEKTFICMENCV
jgi:hypothetical protein